MERATHRVSIFVGYWLPALLFAGFILFLSTRPDLKIELPPLWDLVLRKIGHMGVYFLMTLLLARIGLRDVKSKPVRYSAIVIAGLGSLFLAFMDENIQMVVPGRSGSMSDVGIDLVGILAAGGLLRVREKKRNKE